MRAVVTGGGGFLGFALVRMLCERGDEVAVVGRRRYPHVEALGATSVVLDLAAECDLAPTFEGVDVVFHAAAKAGYWGPREQYAAINIGGTERVVAACRQAGVRRLVHTSSPSVVFSAGKSHRNATEDQCDYPPSYSTHYPETKAQAERLVLAANGPELATVALRPHLIWGPGDPHLLPRLIDRHKSGRLAQIGGGTNQVSLCFIENAAVAHLQAADSLEPGAAHAGKAYFIVDDEPVVFWEFARQLLAGLGMEPLQRKLSYSTARRLVGAVTWTWGALGIEREPPMSPFVVDILARDHSYSSAAATSDFGYRTVVGFDEAFARTIAGFAGDVDSA